MAYTNAWDETTPAGTDNASTADDFFRKHRLDLGERLEDMFYGFNADSNASPENDVGIKSLKFYKQSSDPTSATDFGHFYVKLVSGVPELFYQDDENTTLQLTSGGGLKSTAGLTVDGVSTLTGNVTASGTFESVGVATLADTSVTKTTAAPAADAQIANKKYIDDQITANAPDSDSLCKAWCKVTSGGAISGTGFNITSANRDSTGVYTITWGTDFADTDYAVAITFISPPQQDVAPKITTQLVGSVVVTITSQGSGVINSAFMISAFGDQ